MDSLVLFVVDLDTGEVFQIDEEQAARLGELDLDFQVIIDPRETYPQYEE